MKTFRNKKTIKNLIIIILVITILSALVPIHVQAKTDTEEGGLLLTPIEDFVLFVCDKVMNWLQHTFVTPENIEIEEDVWDFKYSPAIIFSGNVPAFDINFIVPGDDIKVDYTVQIDAETIETENSKQDEYTYTEDNDTKWKNFLKTLNLSNFKEVEKGTGIFGESAKNLKLKYGYYNNNLAYSRDSSEASNISEKNDPNSIYNVTKNLRCREDTLEEIKFWINNDTLYMYQFYDTPWTINNEWFVYKYDLELDETGTANVVVVSKVYTSTAAKLQSTIATWYNALRRIALVGLLSVLVYIGIRMVLSSSSQDKAKYKTMVKDWVVAICLLFTLHYIMSITITVTNEISDIFSTGESDHLLNTLREEIFINTDRGIIVAKTIMYTVLTILTVGFTVQYLKRVIFMAFYTLIAPLITLTYPLDKIKDGQAQAFTLWIREYVYTALLQIIHLVIYTVLVGSALDLVSNYPLYAIIALLFIKKADGIIKKMFGFENSETVGTLGAAATGALIVNALNQIARKRRG